MCLQQRSKFIKFTVLLLLVIGLSRPAIAQIPFTSGPIPLCDTSTFTANVSGLGTLYPVGTPWEYSLHYLAINITSDHPQTLQILLTSPQGTTLLLSAFNGAGGQNYTNTYFDNYGSPSITTGTAPFSGNYSPQGGNFSVFDYQNANGTWTITVIDTACVNGGTGPGGTWTPGWFQGSGGNGGFTFDFYQPQPTCWGWIPDVTVYLCPGGTVDILSYYTDADHDISVLDINWNFLPDATAVSEPGAYTVQAIDYWSNCYYYAYFEIIATPQIELGPDQVLEQCVSDGPANLGSLFTLTGITPSWSLNGTAITAGTAAVAIEPGTYQLIGQNMGGCNDTALVTLTFVDDVDLGPDQAVGICPGSSADLTSIFTTTGYTVVWTFNGVVISAPNAASDAGVYALTASSGNGCTATAEVTLTLEAIAMLGADQSVDLCENATLDLNSLYTTTGLTSEWTSMGVPVADPAAVSAPGNYQLVASNGAECADTALVFVNIVAGPALGTDATDAICPGGSADLTTYFDTNGLVTEWTYAGGTVPDPTAVDSPGQYALIATDAYGCSDAALLILSLSAGAVLGPDQQVAICDGSSTDLTSLYTTTGYTVEWSFNGNVIAAPSAVSEAGTYELIATSADGCSAFAEVVLALDAPPELGADLVMDVCSNTTVDLTTLYSTNGLTTSWTSAGNSVLDPTAVSTSGSYQLIAGNSAGCSDTAVVTVNVLAGPDPGANGSVAICDGNEIDLNDYFTTTGSIASWTFSGSAVADPSAVNAPGPYTLIATDANGCSATAELTVTLSADPVVGPDQSVTVCEGTPVDLTTLYDAGMNTVLWSQNGVPVEEPGSVTASGSYSVEMTNAEGCSATAIATITLMSAPAIGQDGSASICSGTSFDLTSLFMTNDLNEVWTLNGTTVADPTNVDLGGIYQLVATNGTGCSDTAVVSLTVNAIPELGADQSFTLCPWQTIDLSTVFPVAGMITTYTWNGEDVEDPEQVSEVGTYVVAVINANGCTDEVTATMVGMECLCEADLRAEVDCMQEPAHFTLLADSLIISAQWEFSGHAPASTAIDPEVRFSSDGDVLVTLRVVLSCGEITVERTVHVQDCADLCNIYIPSAFTPNDDAMNDTWGWYGSCVPDDYYLEVYDRWGEAIFTTNDPQQSWDGTFGGRLSPTGIYAYRVGYNLPYQERKEVVGSITLLR